MLCFLGFLARDEKEPAVTRTRIPIAGIVDGDDDEEKPKRPKNTKVSPDV